MATTSFYSSTGLAAEDATALESYKNQAALSAEASATSATAAASSLTDARAAQTAAELALDSFTDIYLGAKSSAPSVDNDGDALVTGTQYFDTTLGEMQVYNGSTWQFASLSEALEAPNNLSELTNAATARTNLGLGTAATTASSDYATAAQGSAAVSALSASTLNTTKLNTIETNADVTDTANVVAALSAGTGIGLSSGGEISNSAPDQTVALTGSGATSVSGTYPNFTIASTNTTYSVGDGGLTQNNFTDALKTKLDGVATNANNYVLPFTDNSSNWNTAFGWGNHASQSYATQTYVDTEIASITSGSAAQNMTGDIDMNNNDIIDVHLLKFNDPGWDEGIEWLQGNGWKICESPNNQGNGGGNLQFGTGTTRRATLDTSGSLWTQAQGTLLGSSVANTITHDSGLTLRTSSQGAGSKITMTDNPNTSYDQSATITYKHSDSSSYGSKNSVVFDSTETTMSVVAKDKLLFKSLYQVPSSGTGAGTVVVDENRNITANDITMTGDLTLEDSERVRFGDSQDFDIYFDGSDARIRAHNGQLKLQANGKNALVAVPDGKVELSYNGVPHLETSMTGVTVDGDLKVDDDSNTVVKVGGYAANSRSMLELAEDRNNSNAMNWGFSLCAEGDSDNNFHLLRHSNSTTGVKALTVARDTGDISFRNDSGTEKLIWDASADKLTVNGTVDLNAGSIDGTAIGASSASTGAFTTLTASGAVTGVNATFTTADNSDNLTLTSTDADANSGPNVKLYRNSSSPADGDSLGFINFYGENDADEETLYGQIRASIADASNGSEDTRFIIQTAVGGTQETSRVELTGTETIINEDSKDLDFRVESDNSTHALFVQGSSGNVGIGTSSPVLPLDIVANGGANALSLRTRAENDYSFLTFRSNDGSEDLGGLTTHRTAALTSNLLFYTNNGGSAAERARIDSSGNLLVGGTSLGQDDSFGVSQNGKLTIAKASSGSAVMASFKNGGTSVGTIVTSTTSTSYNTSSDQRLKENIADADDAGSKVDAIQVRKYDWKADGSHQDYGMIAQELQTVAPEAVSGDADSEEMMGVDYSKLVPMLIKEIQSLRNRVAQLEE